MDKFIEMYNLSRLNQEIENMNRTIATNETESVTTTKKTFQQTKVHD